MMGDDGGAADVVAGGQRRGHGTRVVDEYKVGCGEGRRKKKASGSHPRHVGSTATSSKPAN